MKNADALVATAALLLATVASAQLRAPVQVGDEIALSYHSPAFSGQLKTSGDAQLVWRQEIYVPAASYIAPHFSHFNLPPGAKLTIRHPEDAARSWTFTGFGKADHLITEGFWGFHVYGDTAVLELTSTQPIKPGAVVVDKIAHGFPDVNNKLFFNEKPDLFSTDQFGNKAICGADDAQWAKCYQSSEATIYNKARAVARLLINGFYACTGWLVGDDGHLLTNNHCIGNAADALNTNFELMAEGGSCGTSCASWGACPGTIAATTSTFVQTDTNRDFTLVKLASSLASTYGFMQLRSSGAVNGERIYIPQHPAHWGKNIAVSSTHASNPSGYCEVDSLNQIPCVGGSETEVGYYCDTQGGSSGAPVLAYSDHCVVALHHCANCQNRGIKIQNVISSLGNNLPNNALCGAPTPTPPNVTVFGPSSRGANQSGTWTVSVSGGTPPYTYSWFKSSSNGITDLGTGTSVTTSDTTSFNIVCDVLNAAGGSVATDHIFVNVTGGSGNELPF